MAKVARMAADVVIVGAGAAGCVLAAKLSEDPRRRVLLVEAGGRDWHPAYRVPIMAGLLYGSPRGNWLSETEPEPALNRRRILWPRGKVMGGSTTINGMIWHRGRPSDYERWAAGGLPAWNWDAVLPLFRALERFEGGSCPDHGADGPVPVTLGTSDNPLHEAFLRSAEEAGHAATADYNAPPYEGAGRYHFTISGGERWSAARSVLQPALARPNLRVLRHATVTRVLFEGRRACGIGVASAGREVAMTAGRVILAAGTIGSPAILLRSGLGPASDLRALGIPVVDDRPGVGANLQDHLSLRVQHACLRPITLHALTRVDRAALAFLAAAVLRRGVGTTMPIGSGLHFRSYGSEPEPDIQAFFTPSHSQSTVRLPFMPAPPAGALQHAYSLSFYAMRPHSRGRLTLRDSDPASPPVIRAGYLADARDRERMHRALHLVRKIMAQPSFAPFRGEELQPGGDVTTAPDIDRWIAQTAGSAFHPVGTCKMGLARDPDAVVDQDLAVIGVEGLTVADASVMPSLTSGNTMAPAMMIALRCAQSS